MMKGLIQLCLFSTLFNTNVYAEDLSNTIDKIKPSIVAIGTYNRSSSPNSKLLGTGFVVGDGLLVATNAHVIPEQLNDKQKEKLVAFVGDGKKAKARDATIVKVDSLHDIALIRISGPPMIPLLLSEQKVREGKLVAFTGFPLGAVLGLHPVTHRGIVSSITPIVTPARTTKELTFKQLKALKNPYHIYQLDATAYPGNSGSPVFDPATGEVLAIINKVLVKSTKESILSNPSAITYAIPIEYLRSLMLSEN